jgi:DNA transposition AAA+ family ATPase
MGDMLPHLSIHTLSLTSLANSDYHLNLVVENTGFLSTATTKQALKRASSRGVRVEIELPEGASLVSGKQRTELGHLQGRSNKLEVTYLWEASPTDNRARAEWVLHAQPGSVVKLNILSDRAGSIHREINLP